MINPAIEEDLKRTSLNDVNYADYIKENYIPIEVLLEIRQEIAEYGSICVEYVARNRGDRDIELLIEDVLRQAKEQVLEIIDSHINNDQFERIWQNTVEEMKRRKINEI